MYCISRKVWLAKWRDVALLIWVKARRKEQFVSAPWSTSITWQEWEAVLLILFIQCSSQCHHCLCLRRHKVYAPKECNSQRHHLMPTKVLWRALQLCSLTKCYHWPLISCLCSDQNLFSPAVKLCCCPEPVHIAM